MVKRVAFPPLMPATHTSFCHAKAIWLPSGEIAGFLGIRIFVCGAALASPQLAIAIAKLSAVKTSLFIQTFLVREMLLGCRNGQVFAGRVWQIKKCPGPLWYPPFCWAMRRSASLGGLPLKAQPLHKIIAIPRFRFDLIIEHHFSPDIEGLNS